MDVTREKKLDIHGGFEVRITRSGCDGETGTTLAEIEIFDDEGTPLASGEAKSAGKLSPTTDAFCLTAALRMLAGQLIQLSDAYMEFQEEQAKSIAESE